MRRQERLPSLVGRGIPMAAAGGLQRHAIGNRFRFFENLVGKFAVNICQSRYRALPGKGARHTLVEGANLRVGRPSRSDVPVLFHHVSTPNLPVRPRRSAYVVQTMSRVRGQIQSVGEQPPRFEFTPVVLALHFDEANTIALLSKGGRQHEATPRPEGSGGKTSQRGPS